MSVAWFAYEVRYRADGTVHDTLLGRVQGNHAFMPGALEAAAAQFQRPLPPMTSDPARRDGGRFLVVRLETLRA